MFTNNTNNNETINNLVTDDAHLLVFSRQVEHEWYGLKINIDFFRKAYENSRNTDSKSRINFHIIYFGCTQM